MSSKSGIPLNDFITLQRGFDLPSQDRKNGNVPIVASTGVVGTHDEIRVKAPGVVIGRSGSIGGGQYVTTDFWPLNTTLWVKDFKCHNPRYVYYLLKSIDFKQFNVGSGVPTLNRNHLSSVLVKDIGLEQEEKLASIVGAIDDKIELNNQINQTLEAMAQAIFKSWFVDFEPVKAKMAVLQAGGSLAEAELAAMMVISGKTAEQLSTMRTTQLEAYQQLTQTAALFLAAMQESELGEIPERWKVKGLDSIANYLNGLALQKFRPKDGEASLPVLKIAQLKAGVADREESASADIKPEYVVDNGDVIFSWSGSLVVDIWCGGKVALNQHLFKVTSTEYPKWFFYYCTKHHLNEFQRIAAAKAVTMGHIKREHLTSALCAVDEKAIEAVNKALSDLLEQQITLRIQNRQLSDLRDNLLPKLLSGEIDLSAIEEVAA